MSDAEYEILDRHGGRFPRLVEMVEAAVADPHYRCPKLVDGRCSVYEDRPTVCRLWGATEAMPCRWGCIPDYGGLTAAESDSVMRRSLTIGSASVPEGGSFLCDSGGHPVLGPFKTEEESQAVLARIEELRRRL